MSVFNTRPVTDVRKVLSGKDGGIFDEEGVLMATVESFQSQVNISNGKFIPLGDAQEHSTMQSYAVTLKFSKIKIETDAFLQKIVEGMKKHAMPVFNFQGVMHSPYNGSEERMIYRDCVPDGTIDLQNMQSGDFVKTEWNWAVNQPPDLQSLLTCK